MSEQRSAGGQGQWLPRSSGDLIAVAARGLLDIVVLVRLPSCLAGGASAMLGAYLARGVDVLTDPRVALAGAGMSCAVGVANVVNDIVDVDVDAIEKDSRPLPSGRVTIRAAWALAAALTTAAVGFAGLIGGGWAAAMLVVLGLAVAYSMWFKDTVLLGNAVVATCASTPILYGALTAGAINAPVWVATGLTALFMFSYETLKTISDHDGDKAAGIGTFATRFGVDAATRLFRVLVTVLTMVALAACAVPSRPLPYLSSTLVAYAAPALTAAALLGRQPRRAAVGRAVLLMRVAWFLGVAPLWLLR